MKRAQRSLTYLEVNNLVTHEVDKDLVITFGKKTVYLNAKVGCFHPCALQNEWVTCLMLIAYPPAFCSSFKELVS